MKSVVFALFFVVLSSAYKVNVVDDAKSSDFEYPEFNLTDDQPLDGSYDVRRYAAAKWVSTMVRDCFEKEAKEAAFYRLYEYVNGNNDKGIEVLMSAPIVTEVQTSSCVFCGTNYIMSFCIPSEYQDNPPVPMNPNVYIESAVATTFYVKTFRGEVSPQVSKTVAQQLFCDLQRNNVMMNKVEKYHMFISEYGNPLSGWHPQSEIWIPQRSEFESDGLAFDKDPYNEQDDRRYELL